MTLGLACGHAFTKSHMGMLGCALVLYLLAHIALAATMTCRAVRNTRCRHRRCRSKRRGPRIGVFVVNDQDEANDVQPTPPNDTVPPPQDVPAKNE